MTSKTIALLPVLATLALLGCGSPPKYDYVRPDASPYEKKTALASCQYRARLNKTPPARQEAAVRRCMQRKGYRHEQVAGK